MDRCKLNRTISSIIILFLFSFASFSQNSHILGLRSHYGFIIPHAEDLKPYAKSNPWGIELEWNLQLMSQDAWNYCFCYPRTGVSFLYINFANQSILGNSYSFYAFIEPVLGAERKLHASFRFGIGPAIMDNPYDSVSNPENTFFSSYISFVVLLNAALNYRITERTNLRIAASFNHISNGGIQNPNRGINFPTLNIGVDYNIKPQPYLERAKDKSIDLHPKKWRYDVVAFGSAKTDIKGQAHYPVYGLYGNVSRVFARLSAVSMGLEGTVDLADKEEIERLGLTEDGEYIDHKYFAGLLGYELLIGRFIFSIRFGAYIYSPFERMDPIYQRYGLTFHLSKRFFFGFDIKAHRHVADFLDFRIGISF